VNGRTATRPWVPVVVLLAVTAFVVLGGFVVAAALSRPAGPPVVVGGGAVTVFPLSGWQSGQERSDGSLTGVGLTRGDANLDVLTTQVSVGPEEVLTSYVARVLRPASQRLSVSRDITQVSLDSGLPALRVSYTGTFGDRAVAVEGEVTVAVSPVGTAAIFDGWGPIGQFGYARGDVREMVRTAAVR
jgi:hypothetical protein